MKSTLWALASGAVSILTLSSAIARAEVEAAATATISDGAPIGRTEEVEPYRLGFAELTGAWGVQFGVTAYLPDGAPGQWKHPFVQGPAAGLTAGGRITQDLYGIINYEYTTAQTRTGEVPGIIQEFQGFVEYHSLLAGLRTHTRVGPGWIFGEFAVGVIFPYKTRREVTHGAMLAALPQPITGEGELKNSFNIAPGVHGVFGYQLSFHDRFYLGGGLKVKAFQGTNNEETTRLTNFVQDYAATPPVATTGEIRYGDGAAQPSTSVVADVRAQLQIGMKF